MKKWTDDQKQDLFTILQQRFEKFPKRHEGIIWEQVQEKLNAASDKQLSALLAMEETGGEPDVIGTDTKNGAIIFCDCAAETPKDRRSLCYDQAALDARKQNKPAGNVVETAKAMGIELLDEELYKKLQEVGPFDQKTSSWIETPKTVRDRGGALFGDYRFGRVFIYHNGAESYYGARGFRGLVRI
ncbi:DUF4256 domain-containing protein [Sphingobacterium corticis]|uniref:DUF4256 domain-containing protein n=1 Tax=Sphingobacterium corticis TaxID=1812823 RepID=A0ABW5NP90_9SPHI